MINRLSILALILLCVIANLVSAQEEAKKKMSFSLQLDSRNTFVRTEAVGIFGVRAGLVFNNKFELGLGAYGTRLLDFLGKEVEKDYLDQSQSPAQLVPALIGFEYISLYGEYLVLENDRWNITANSQYGMGRVNIRIQEPNTDERLKRERKSLIEHSVKAKYQFNSWLQLIGGLGYRYLLSGEKQVKKAFNAPIYIISAEIDFKTLIQALKK
ncbi:MAG: hypothetical protein HEP71_00475 [Roseivirga sp.]|nr:hypothetical protein [Roseivirga sp.]